MPKSLKYFGSAHQGRQLRWSLSLMMLALLGAAGRAEKKGARPAPQNDAEVTQRIDTEARRIFVAKSESTYSHITKINEEKRQFDCDCSGLVCYVLKRVAPKIFASVEKTQERSRPVAQDFYIAFEKSPADEKSVHGPWRRIDRFSDARPGDIMAWTNPSHVLGDKENSGHVMIIDGIPEQVRTSKPTEDRIEWRVTVIDSSMSRHDNDSRQGEENGVGRGGIFIQTDKAGKTTGYRWKSVTGTFHEEPVMVGRAVE